ncbi:MAG: DUF3016 domain-containing protein [Pseudomonadota bacterium]
MKSITTKLALAALLAASANAAMAGVTVTYVQPEKFSDVPLTTFDRDEVIRRFSEHFALLGRTLPAGQELSIEVLDIDLAGRARPSGMRPDLRVLRGGADWPVMHLRWRLEQGGKLLRSGDETIKDMAYMNHANHYANDETLRYEKQMIDDWFKHTVLPLQPG